MKNIPDSLLHLVKQTCTTPSLVVLHKPVLNLAAYPDYCMAVKEETDSTCVSKKFFHSQAKRAQQLQPSQ